MHIGDLKKDMTGRRSQSDLLRNENVKDHPLVAWMIENSSCWLIAFVRLGIFGSRLSMKTTTSKMINMIGTTLITVRRVVRE